MTETHTEMPRLLRPEFLIMLHEAASEAQDEQHPLLHRWGLHLMEDWRSLELSAEKFRQ